MTYRYTPPFGLRILQIVILIESLTRGIAYIVTPQVVLSETDIVNSAPIQVWGSIFIAFAVLGLFGEALMSGVTKVDSSGGNPRAWPSFIAHSGLMVLYAALSLAYASAVLDGELTLSSAPGAVLVFGYIHWLFARRRKSHVA
ncbi:minor tail protein [Mycobacterium phage ArcherNM]|uniref:minor tail protein n=1 Tax=Mycobacterium phage ArcherNM TaxID=1815972 RepID=UPI00078B2EB3|nr:minor tail protein [Mycobacterium phage ArcherNM]AMS01026.1 minor tail protein [Mycobacterium phage ArcherNM]